MRRGGRTFGLLLLGHPPAALGGGREVLRGSAALLGLDILAQFGLSERHATSAGPSSVMGNPTDELMGN